MKQRLFHPYTGEDLGYALPAGYRFTQWLLVLHDNLLLGTTGVTINGLGAFCFVLLSATGAVIWWPGIRSWRRSLTVDTRANWKRLNWSLHSALGFWFVGFILMWGISGIYLSFSGSFMDLAEFLEPSENYEPDARVSDRIMYWLAYAHFGRFGGRIPGCGSTCDSTLKVVWAVFGLVPPLMFVTGALIWWNRVIRPGARRSQNAVAQGGLQSARE